MRSAARALLLAISIPLHHTLAQDDVSSTTTLTSTTTVATTTVTVTLSRHSHLSTTTYTSVGPTTIAAASASPKPSNNMAQSNSLQSVVLNSTNWYRQHYEASNVTWNSTLASFAQDYAKGCIWQHSGGPYGENLAANFENATLAIDAWGNEESSYNYDKKKFSETTGHFTQLVWSNTTSVGCGLVQCNNAAENGVKGAYLVCEYSPRGNVQGQFNYNVRKPGAAVDGELGFGGAEGRAGARSSIATLVVACLLLAILC